MNTLDLERVRLGVKPAIFGPFIPPPPPVIDLTEDLKIFAAWVCGVITCGSIMVLYHWFRYAAT